MHERHQRLCIWLGIAFMPIFLIGLLIAGWLPPPSPGDDAAEITRMYSEDRDRIRVGVWVLTAAAPLLAFYVAALSHQLRRIVGAGSPLITAQTAAGTCLILEFIFPQLVWQTAAYRSERDADTVLMLNDLGWLPYIGVVGTAIAQMVIIAIAVFQDERPEPVLPRWSAYLNLWAALGVAAGSFCVFTQSGPLAWNGILSWWVLAVSFFIWMVTMTVLMRGVSRRTTGQTDPAPVRDEVGAAG